MEYLPSYKDDLYLAHHGVKGQKWGVRRYQNPDGSLTPEGKKRIDKYSETGAEIGGTVGMIGGLFIPGLTTAGIPIGGTAGYIAGNAIGKAIGKGVVSGKINKKLGIKVAKGAAITTGILAGSYGAVLLSDELKASNDFKKSKDLAEKLVSDHLSDLSPQQQDFAKNSIARKNNDVLINQRVRKNRARKALVKDTYDAYINPKTRSFEKRAVLTGRKRSGYYRVNTGDFNDIGIINDNTFSRYEDGIRRAVNAPKK